MQSEQFEQLLSILFKSSISWNIYVIKTKWHSSLKYVANWLNSPNLFCKYRHRQNDKIIYFIGSLQRLRHPGQKIENKAKCLLKIKPRSSFEIHERAIIPNVFSLSAMRWKVKLEILKHFRKGSKTKQGFL